MSKPPVDVAIVGGGFFGLALAYRLRRRSPEARVVLLEASDRLGGKALTDRVETSHGDFLVEAGPDSFLAAKPWALQLAADLGLSDELLPINRVARPVSVVKQGRLIRMPAGLNLAAPSLLKPFARSRLLSPSGRVRALREPYVPSGSSDGDEAVGAFIRRRLGQEMLDWVAEPLMAGIYNGDPEQMSLLATFPQLRVQEREQGGLIRAARRARMNQRGPRPPVFLTFRHGMQTLTNALAGEAGHVARLDATVEQVCRDGSSAFLIQLRDGDRIAARQVVLATSARESARLIEATVPEAAEMLAEFRTNPAGSVSFAFRDAVIGRPLPGYGLLAPFRAARPINAITVASKKFNGRAPDGWTLLRVFFGGARSPETMGLSDDELLAVVRDQLRELLRVEAPPLFHRITRWPSGSPQYDVGHLERVAAVEAVLPVGMHIGGSAYRGVGLPDLAHEAELLTARLVPYQSSESR